MTIHLGRGSVVVKFPDYFGEELGKIGTDVAIVLVEIGELL